MKKFLLFSLSFFLFSIPVFVFATATINANLPGMAPATTSTPPGSFVAGFYSFALMIGGVLAFGAVVWGGILYAASAGNPGKQSEGRDWIKSALLGLLLLAGAYLVLHTINPNLVNLGMPTSLVGVNVTFPAGGAGGGGGGGGASCAPPASGPCANAANLSCFGSAASFMQGVCNRESGGNAGIPSGVDIGADGNPVSFGLFQINISATSLTDPATGKTVPCSTAFSTPYTAQNHTTVVTNQALYNQCVALAEDPTANIDNACAMSKGGTYLTPWKTPNSTCGI